MTSLQPARHRALALMLVIGIGIAALAAPATTWADDDPDPERVKRVEREANAIQKAVEELRGLKFAREVKKGIQTEAQLRAFIEREFKKEMSGDDFRNQHKALIRLGLVPADFPLEQKLIDLYSEQVAGFYDHERKELFLIAREGGGGGEMAAANDRFVMAHELHHALQDQNFDLGQRMRLVAENEDELNAYKSLVEGEATLVGFAYLMEKQYGMKRVPPLGPLMKQMTGGGGAGAMASMPDYIKEGLVFPYTDGAVFIQTIYDKYGWDRITEMFADPPRSTEQVLHPEKYIGAREDPVAIRLPDLASTVGGADELWSNTLGEFNIGILLRQAHPVGATKKAAAGWAGDRFTVLETREDKRPVLIWMTVWDSAEEADEFYGAYKAVLDKKYAGTIHADGDLAWDGAAGDLGLVERNGSASVLVIEGAKDAVEADKLRHAAWASLIVHERFSAMGELREQSLTGDAPAPTPTPAPSTTPTPTPTIVKKGPRFADEETGFGFAFPSGAWKKTEESIPQLAPYVKAVYQNEKTGASVRLVDVPVPFDADGMKFELEGYAEQLFPSFKMLSDKKHDLAGRPALTLEFEGELPELGMNQIRATAVGNEGFTLVLIMAAPKDKWSTAKSDFDHIGKTAGFGGEATPTPTPTPVPTPVPTPTAKRFTDEVSGISFLVPGKDWMQTEETIDEIAPYVSVRFHHEKSGGDVRLVELPFGFDPETLKNEIPGRAAEIFADFELLGTRDRKVGGRDAVEIMFKGRMPNATTGKSQIWGTAIDAEGVTLLFLLSSPVETWDAVKPGFEQLLASSSFGGESTPTPTPAPSAPTPSKRKTFVDADLGFAFALPGADWNETDETIGQLAAYTKARFHQASTGGSIRLVDIPLPFDKEGLKAEVQNYAEQIFPEYQLHAIRDLTVAGRDAFQLEFDGVLPGADGTNRIRATALDNSGFTVLFIQSAPEKAFDGLAKQFDAVLASARFGAEPAPSTPTPAPSTPTPAPTTPRNPKTVLADLLGSWESVAPAMPFIKAHYKDADGAHVQLIEAPIGGGDLEGALQLAEERLPSLLDRYKKISRRKITFGGQDAYEIIFEAVPMGVDAEGLHRFREIVTLTETGGVRLINCFAPDGSFAGKAKTFDRVLHALGPIAGEGGGETPAKPTKPTTKPRVAY